MGKLRTILTGAALAALTVTAMPLAAHAAGTAPAPVGTGTSAAPPADGKLYAYEGYNYTGFSCSWTGNSNNWGQCRNQASSLWNNGFPGNLDDVWVYWAPNRTEARRGVHNGVAISNLATVTFDAGTGKGAGQNLNDNISSHQWTNL
ncbi:peptidase inhibitor family I36 protein [Streptomyces aureoversilis]|uniref:Peptidase inhibitor family I36 protein n=1 Tax=Streptomyces aureoversilis TaxID=67277 RepID=A0ABV9ZWC5_9ACTN